MKMDVWDKKLVDHLLAVYDYDGEKGEVRRKLWPAKGPKSEQPLGSLTAQGDLILCVINEGRMKTIRMAKLCVLVETGLQYPKVIAKDGNRANLKWENLVPVGLPFETKEEAVEQVEEVNDERMAKHLEYRRLLREEREAAYAAKLLNKPVREKKRTKAEIAQDEQEERTRRYARNAAKVEFFEKHQREFDSMIANHPRTLAERELRTEVRSRFLEVRHLWGVYTGISAMHAEMFLVDCDRAFGPRKWEELATEKPLEEYSEKVEHDRAWVARMWRGWKVRNLYTFDQYVAALGTYRWKGEVVEGEYDKMPVELQKQLDEGLARIALEHGPLPAYRPPVYEEPGEVIDREEVQAAIAARAEAIAAQRAGREVGEQSFDSIRHS